MIIQTYWPEHPAVRAVATRDPEIFYAKERRDRGELGFPPFGRMANVTVTSRDRAAAKGYAGAIAQAIAERAAPHVSVLGPSPAPLARIKDRYRWHVVVKVPVGDPLPELLREALGTIQPVPDVSVAPDIDPLDLM